MIIGITVGFFSALIVSIYLGKYIPFVEVVVAIILGIFSAVLGLTDIFSSSLGMIFFGEAIIFLMSVAILIYRELYS